MTRWFAAAALLLAACPQSAEAPAPPEADAAPEVPSPPPSEAVAASADEAILFASVQGKLVPLARTCADMEGGGACDDDVPVGGTAAAASGSTAVLGEATQVVCAVDGRQATAFAVAEQLSAPVYFSPPEGASRWVSAAEAGVDDPVRAGALAGLTEANFGFEFPAEQLEAAVVHQVLAVDLDGDGAEDPVIRVFMTSTDADKPGNSALYWGADLRPISNRAHGLTGRVDALGALTSSHGAVLVLADEWMGGSGVHAYTASGGELRLLGEWSCGT